MATALAPFDAPAMTVLFSDLPGTQYAVKRAFSVDVSQDEAGHFIASEPRTGVFHYADRVAAAVEGFIGAFVNQYEFLVSKEANLSPSMKEELEQFRHLIAPRA